MRVISAFAIAIPLTAAAGSAQAQAWTRDAGNTYLDLGVGYVSGGAIYDSEFGVTDLPTRYSQLTVSGYAEVGIVDRWLTASFSGELFRLNQLDAQGRTYGLGDLRLGLWSGLVAAPFRLTLGVWLGLPTGDPSPAAGSGASDAARLVANSLPTGDGEWDVEPQLLAGYGFAPDGWFLNHYVQAAVGYHLRTRGESLGVSTDFADAFTYRLEAGLQPRLPGWDRLWLSARFYGVESFASTAQAASGAVGLGNGVTYTAFQIRLYTRIIDTFGVAASVEGALRARSIIAAPVFRVALSYELAAPGQEND